ncbi:hypothetical protein AB0A74_41470 [Saccharothrix sp. NPDC042600]|uniref:hypothetical protein n=1 Tax=Saccharothrix TaxID=2071 RepID=UPI0033F1F526|nr:hypothetical protein GCM10017745_60100 [Saccharothrix mutabilis subsp. capreolus]
MSTSPKRDADGVPAVPHEEQADFLGDTFLEARQACREAVAEGALPYVAYFSRGVFTFSTDEFGDADTDRAVLNRLGRQLGHVVGDLDRALQEPRTGPLIRTLLHTDHGAIMCNLVVPRENVVAVTFGAAHPDRPLTDVEEVNEADRALAALVARLRKRISLPSLNPGGWESAQVVRALNPVGDNGEPRVAEYQELPEEIRNACRASVRPEDLHYVAYYAGGELALEADHLDHPTLEPFFTQVAVDTRRSFYRVFGRQLEAVARRFNRLIAGGPPGGLVRRFVLDVEQGAVYYYRLDVGSYLVGVTIDQSRVRDSDERLSLLSSRFSSLLRRSSR